MCGIAGIFDLQGTRDIPADTLKRMTDALAHRGPDGEGQDVAPGLALGHRRLSIIDLEGGKQPFKTASGAWLTFNGEIYNFQALRDELQRDGTSFRTRSDTEVLAALIERHGDAALSRLNGMFAFAAWDPRSETLLLARDRLGEKPLYYTYTDDGFFLFASEISAVLASGMVKAEIEPTAVADYMFYGYVPDPKTIYRNIAKLPAGHLLSLQRGRPSAMPQAWWTCQQTGNSAQSFEEATEALLSHLDQIVQDQMVADVPICAFLSGGVDSGAIVSAMSQSDRPPPTTCTIGFEQAAFDETARAQLVAERYGTSHVTEMATTGSAVDDIDRLAAIYGEPFADTSSLPTLMVSGLARKNATVALSGDGADEIFAGYRRYAGVLREARLRDRVPRGVRRHLVGPLSTIYPDTPRLPQPLRLSSALKALSEDQEKALARASSIITPEAYSAAMAPAMSGYRPQSIVEDAARAANTDDPVLQAQAVDLATWLPGRMLVKVDRASMAQGLEVRVPFLDYRLVEWAAKLPQEHRLNAQTRKRVLKSALADRLPHEVLYSPKRGFDTPVNDWFRTPQSGLMDRLNTASLWRDSGYFDVARVERMASDHASGRADRGQLLWSVLAFDAFLRLNAR